MIFCVRNINNVEPLQRSLHEPICACALTYVNVCVVLEAAVDEGIACSHRGWLFSTGLDVPYFTEDDEAMLIPRLLSYSNTCTVWLH